MRFMSGWATQSSRPMPTVSRAMAILDRGAVCFGGVLSGAMDPVRSAELRGHEEAAVSLLQEILAQGQKRGEVTRAFPVVHLAEFMEGLYNAVVRQWAVDLTGPHKLTDRVRSAVDFFLRGIRP